MSPTEKFELAMRWNVYILLIQVVIAFVPLLLVTVLWLLTRRRQS